MNDHERIANYLLQNLHMIKMFHWFAHTYDQHKIFDKLFEDLSDEVDAFMENILSIKTLRIPYIPKNAKTSSQDLLSDLEKFINSIRIKRVEASIDNMNQIIGKYRYLLLLK